MKKELKNDPLAYKITPVVIIYLFNRENKVLLMKREKPPFFGYWEPIGGSIEFQEKVSEAASREVKEEIGRYIPTNKLKFITIHDHIFDNSYHRILFVFATKVDSKLKIKLSEHSKYKWFDIDRLPRLIPGHQKLLKLSFSKIIENT